MLATSMITNPLFARLARQRQRELEQRLEAEAAARTAREILISRGVPKWARDTITDMAANLNIPMANILHDSRRRPVSNARNAIIYKLKETKPTISSLQLGRWFAKNHVTVLYCIAAHAKAHGLPAFTKFDVEARRQYRRDQWGKAA